jgi:hypothetical protein
MGNERYHRNMSSDMPPGAFPPDQGQRWDPSPPTPSAPAPLAPPTAFHRPPRWPALTALAVALTALAVSLAGWFRSEPHNNQPPPKPTYTQQQISDAKAKVCAAFAKLDRAVSVGNALPRGSDPLVAAINSRQIFDVFSRHLLTTLSEEPATPPDLATAVRKEASTLEQVVIADQDGFSNSDPELRPVVDANSAAAETIRQLCK